MSTFSSSVNDGPVMITGIYYSEDLYEFLARNPLLNRVLNVEIRRRRMTDKTIAEVDCTKGKWAAIRLLMFYFR